MTTEQKAKAYDEAVNKLRRFMTQGVDPLITRADVQDFFPELAESEDEKIRKELIEHIKANKETGFVLFKKFSPDDIIAWLEKQGQTFTKKDIDDAYLKGVSDAKHELEKQDEKEPYDQRKECLDCQFNYAGECKGSCQMKRGEQKPVYKVEPKFKVKYAGSEYNVLDVKDIAGVTYYVIEDEPNHIDYIQAENCERVDGYSIKESGSPFPTKPAKFSEQKSAWSEEDEKNLQGIIDEIQANKSSAPSYDINVYDRFLSWLKFLKQRIGG